MQALAAALLVGSILGPASAIPTRRDIRGSIPAGASDIENSYQPLLDFDTDGCYYTSAIDSSGNTNPGISNVLFKNPQDDCRTPDRLQNSNVYSRKRCNNGVCAIMYEYYFEKDQTTWGSFIGGHVHDWENIVVFVRNNVVVRVAPSCHGGYGNARNAPNLPLAGAQAKVVYHKDGIGTHCFRIANGDDERIENYTGRWFAGKLVGWDSWPGGLRQRVLDAWSGGVGPKLPDNKFADTLRAAAGSDVPGFDPTRDG